MKKDLLLIYTGGTIGMAKTAKGYAPKPHLLQELMAKMTVFQHEDMPSYDILEYTPLLDSSDMTPEHWGKMAQDIQKHYQDYKGFVILHGTDTMAYSASGLSFLLENLGKPVIFTGSQVPLMESHTDASENLVCAMILAARFAIPEVCIYFDNRLYRGNRSRKVHATRFDAYDSPNYPALADVGVNFTLYPHLIRTNSMDPLIRHNIKSANIAQLLLFPGFNSSLMEPLLEKNLQALIIQTYGVGNTPSIRQDFIALMKKASEKNIIVLNCTQCISGSVHMDNYSSGKMLLEAGVISGHDMTPEAAVAKLHFLFAQNSKIDEIKKYLEKDLRGEMTV